MTSPDKPASSEAPKRLVVTVEFNDDDSAKIRAAVERLRENHLEMNPHAFARYAARRLAAELASGEPVLLSA